MLRAGAPPLIEIFVPLVIEIGRDWAGGGSDGGVVADDRRCDAKVAEVRAVQAAIDALRSGLRYRWPLTRRGNISNRSAAPVLVNDA